MPSRNWLCVYKLRRRRHTANELIEVGGSFGKNYPLEEEVSAQKKSWLGRVVVPPPPSFGPLACARPSLVHNPKGSSDQLWSSKPGEGILIPLTRYASVRSCVRKREGFGTDSKCGLEGEGRFLHVRPRMVPRKRNLDFSRIWSKSDVQYCRKKVNATHDGTAECTAI